MTKPISEDDVQNLDKPDTDLTDEEMDQIASEMPNTTGLPDKAEGDWIIFVEC